MISILLALLYFSRAQTVFTVSGFSSGAMMATQLHMAFSSQIEGAGILAGVPYHCAEGSFSESLLVCLQSPYKINITELIEVASNYSSVGKIDDISNLEAKPVYISTGENDSAVNPQNSDLIYQFYHELNANVYKQVIPIADHAFITDNQSCNSCEKYALPFINNCDFNTPLQMLSKLYGSVNPGTPPSLSNLHTYDQTSYGTDISLADTGYVYIPTNCTNDLSSCRIHVALHGCLMNAENIGTQFVTITGYNPLAEANDIVILYPQTKVSYTPSNPNACWDWWGYTEGWDTGIKYDTKEGKQPKAIVAMVEDLAAGKLKITGQVG